MEVNKVSLNPYGEEDLGMLTTQVLSDIIVEDDCVAQLIELIHFNDKYPQNHNIQLPSISSRTISHISSIQDNNVMINKTNKTLFLKSCKKLMGQSKKLKKQLLYIFQSHKKMD